MSQGNNEFTILLLGPESCGKTLLAKSLQYYAENGCAWDFGSIPKHGRPTVGVELTTLTLRSTSKDSKKKIGSAKKQNGISITMRELGGRMAPLWPTYLKDTDARGLIYCVDSLNPFQASRATVELARILNTSRFQRADMTVLIIFTKGAEFDESDQSSARMPVMEMRNMMLLDDILDQTRTVFKAIDVLTGCSAVTGNGLSEILAWMERIASNQP